MGNNTFFRYSHGGRTLSCHITEAIRSVDKNELLECIRQDIAAYKEKNPFQGSPHADLALQLILLFLKNCLLKVQFDMKLTKREFHFHHYSDSIGTADGNAK